jgi:hypothetical protein
MRSILLWLRSDPIKPSLDQVVDPACTADSGRRCGVYKLDHGRV